MSIFAAVEIPNGYSWTITSKLGHILHVAEERFGPRDHSYTILGVEFGPHNKPQVWFPGNRKNIVIQISLACADDINRAVFQVAHEAVHCLSPTGKQNANYLEEGIACLFSAQYASEFGHGHWHMNDQKYETALRLAKDLLSYDPDIIKKLRIVNPLISSIDADTIRAVDGRIPIPLCEKLTFRF